MAVDGICLLREVRKVLLCDLIQRDAMTDDRGMERCATMNNRREHMGQERRAIREREGERGYGSLLRN